MTGTGRLPAIVLVTWPAPTDPLQMFRPRPREVDKTALALNAASVLPAHNHPSGTSEPSESDLLRTRTLAQALALALVDVRILDHFVVASHQVHSFSEHGQL